MILSLLSEMMTVYSGEAIEEAKFILQYSDITIVSLYSISIYLSILSAITILCLILLLFYIILWSIGDILNENTYTMYSLLLF